MAVKPGETKFLYVVRAEVAEDTPVEDWHEWYDTVHVPELLSVPGFRHASRFASRDEPHTFLAMYEVDTPGVFEESRYAEITGWGEWARYIVTWQRAVYEIARTLAT